MSQEGGGFSEKVFLRTPSATHSEYLMGGVESSPTSELQMLPTVAMSHSKLAYVISINYQCAFSRT